MSSLADKADEYPQPIKGHISHKEWEKPPVQNNAVFTNHEQSAKVNDTVNHPAHYCYGPMECIEAMVKLYGVEKTIAYCELAAFKYRWRAGYKGDVKEDIEKALNYERMAKELKDAGNRA